MFRKGVLLTLIGLMAGPLSAQLPPVRDGQAVDNGLLDHLQLAWGDRSPRAAESAGQGPYLTFTAVQGMAGGAILGADVGEEEIVEEFLAVSYSRPALVLEVDAEPEHRTVESPVELELPVAVAIRVVDVQHSVSRRGEHPVLEPVAE